MLAALRTFACSACFEYPCHDSDRKETDDSQNQPYRRFTAVFVRVVCHAAVKAGTYGPYAGHHTRIPVAVFQIRNHVSGLNTFANGIGQVSFQSISGIELDATLVGYQQDNQAVILVFFTHTPFVEQLMRKLKTVFIADRRYDGHYGFNAGLLFQCIKHPVYFAACRSGEDAGRVADIACLVLKVYFRNILSGVNFL